MTTSVAPLSAPGGLRAGEGRPGTTLLHGSADSCRRGLGLVRLVP
ncbi:hypothetical protein [Streptomyces yangpuensis]